MHCPLSTRLATFRSTGSTTGGAAAVAPPVVAAVVVAAAAPPAAGVVGGSGGRLIALMAPPAMRVWRRGSDRRQGQPCLTSHPRPQYGQVGEPASWLHRSARCGAPAHNGPRARRRTSVASADGAYLHSRDRRTEQDFGTLTRPTPCTLPASSPPPTAAAVGPRLPRSPPSSRCCHCSRRAAAAPIRRGPATARAPAPP